MAVSHDHLIWYSSRARVAAVLFVWIAPPAAFLVIALGNIVAHARGREKAETLTHMRGDSETVGVAINEALNPGFITCLRAGIESIPDAGKVFWTWSGREANRWQFRCYVLVLGLYVFGVPAAWYYGRRQHRIRNLLLNDPGQIKRSN